MTRLLVIGALTAELGQAARIAAAGGARVHQAEGVTDGLARLRAEGAELVFCDLAHDIGWLIARLAEERIACPVIACGRNADAAAAVAAIRAGAREFLPLPPEPDLIAAMLAAVAGDAEAAVHRDPAMATLLARAGQLARSEASVLITGESGTGKEVMARHIHAVSRRARGRFVALNCAALPETLLESELFGHEKGAFSGAVAARKGRFEQAEGGTLLLDEIGEMDLRLQAKLLRVIQEREVDRLGGTQPVRVDVRLLAATNRDLGAEVRAGRFREDLFFRLNVVELRIPPLRDRPADIAALAEHFARRFAAANGLPPRPLTPAALGVLAAHPWPGNVRELENAMHRAVLLATGPAIDAAAIELTPAAPRAGAMASPPLGAPEVAPAATEEAAAPGVSRAAPSAAGPAGIATLVGRRVEEVERELILETLAHCLGNRTRAAEILGISIRTLRNKLHEYRALGVAVPVAPGQQPFAPAPGPWRAEAPWPLQAAPPPGTEAARPPDLRAASAAPGAAGMAATPPALPGLAPALAASTRLPPVPLAASPRFPTAEPALPVATAAARYAAAGR